MLISLFIFIFIADYQISSLNPATYNVVSVIVGIYFVCLIAVAIKQVKRIFIVQQQNAELNHKKLETELKLKEAELKLLKAQIHPHFLFNTLNNLYGLALEKAEETPELLLRFSSLLDYMLYRCNQPKVELSMELDYIHNYMALEKIRYGTKLQLEDTITGNINNRQIAPMILLPFVENSFKHGVSKQILSPFIRFNIRIHHYHLYLELENSCTAKSNIEDGYSHGIGLQNVKKRLELLYPGKHLLTITHSDCIFHVNLQLELDVDEE
jgi:LytS/YehU family sensor histidine kinase